MEMLASYCERHSCVSMVFELMARVGTSNETKSYQIRRDAIICAIRRKLCFLLELILIEMAILNFFYRNVNASDKRTKITNNSKDETMGVSLAFSFF